MSTHHVSSERRMAPVLDSPSKYGRDQKYVYKKTSYQYSSTDGNGYSGNEQNVNQLDALLEDLKNERAQTREKDIHASTTSYRTVEPSGTVTKTTRVIKSHQLPLEVDSVADYTTYDLSRDARKDLTAYNTSKSISSNFNSSNTITESNALAPAILEEDAKNLTLTDNILPVPGTKVTTTVRTYTYEIPPDTSTINRTMLYKNNVYNQSRNDYVTDSHIPQSVVYSTESYNTTNNQYAPRSPRDRIVGPNTTNQVYEINDTKEYRTDNYITQPVQPSNKTIVYKVNKSERNVTNVHQGVPLLPQNSPPLSQSPHYPPGSSNAYYYRTTTNTVNNLQGSPGDRMPPNVVIDYSQDSYGQPSPPSSVTYNYTSSTINSRRGPNNDSPSSQPPPFPVEGVIYPDKAASPPTKLNELMDSFGADSADGKPIDTSHRQKREVETAVATSSNQQVIPSVNKAGPAVYYPPGHEWHMKKEESGGGYQASGKWAKGSGMYEYESASKSKSSSKSGAAVVPLCLPLCCAMPCSVM